MAQPVEFFRDGRSSSLLWISQGDWPQQLDRLLLTSPSISELYSRLGEFLLQTVAVDGVWLGSPDDQEKVHCHFSAGEGVARFLEAETIWIDDNADSPLARAWRTGIPQFASDWTDQRNHLPGAFWRERRLRFGWRSSCAIPISGDAGKRDVLILYSRHPKFFCRDYIRRIVLQLHSQLGFALERLRLLEAITKDQQTLALYKTAMDASVNGILIAEAGDDLPIRYVNPAFERMTGYCAEEILGINCRILQGADTSQPQLEIIHQAVRQGKSCTVELRNYRKDGTMFWNSLSIAPVLNNAGTPTHFVGIQKDVTEIRTILSESVHSNALYRALMSTAELVVRAQTERELLAELCRLLVESKLFAQAWIGRPNAAGDLEIQTICSNSSDLKHPSYLPNVLTGDEKSVLAVRAWKRSQTQFTNDRLTDPECLPILDLNRTHELHAAAVVPLYRDGKIWALLTLLSEESNIFYPELLELIERIGRLAGHGLDALDLRHTLEDERKHQSWLARHDPLTDLLNRRGLTERVEEAIARAQLGVSSMAVALADLNGFRTLNELHGHPACDLVLRTVADRLQTSLRPGDAAGRLGGDEFVLVLEDVDEEKLALILPGIQTAVEGPIELSNGRKATIQTSIGVTVFPRDNSTARHLLRHADRALYAMKEDPIAPKSRWMLFQPEADEQRCIHREAVLAQFHKGNVCIYYQPIIDLQTGSAFKVEALARLADDNCLLLPADFLPHFGHVELTALTFQVLSRGIQDMHRLDDAGFHMNLGINLEPATLADPQATQNLRRQIETSGLGTNRIVLELLEHPDTLSLIGSREVLLELKRSGARVALDDIGSGYSSLLRIKELPIDAMKLDRSFMSGLDRQPKELRFLMHLMDLSQTLGIDLIAEGIESNACRDALAALGIRFAQGYAIAMPMNIEELEQWLGKYKPVPWSGPTTLLGGVALQLRDLSMTERILDHKPSLMQCVASFDPRCPCEIGLAIQAIGPEASKLFSAHVSWHTAMAALWKRGAGLIDSRDFQTARAAYEEEMFRLVLEAQIFEFETISSL
jgi:diguanylate cyclase (GGDEF)-like protein/PAS domain S-box-containing protein